MLQRLSLSSARMSESQFVDCLRVTPSIVEHELKYVTITDGGGTFEASRVLNIGISFCLLPNLQKLMYTTQFIDLSGWLEVLLSRWKPTAGQGPSDQTFRKTSRLQSVTLVSSTGHVPDASTLGGFRKLAEEGMEISLVTDVKVWL